MHMWGSATTKLAELIKAAIRNTSQGRVTLFPLLLSNRDYTNAS